MARARITYLSEAEKEFVHEKTLEVLAKVGVAYNTPRAIDLLEAAGARVDREALTARLTWDVIEAALKTVPRTVLLAGRDPSQDRLLGGERLIATSDGMTTYMLDDVTGERREGTTADLADVTRLCDALEEIDTLWPSPNPGDAPADLLPLVTQATMVRNSTKHIQDEVRTPEMVEPILEIYEAACGAPLTERPCFSVTNCTIAPLQHDRDMTEAGLKLVRARRAHLRPAHAAGRDHGADDPARHLHPEHGGAALGHRALPGWRTPAAPSSPGWARRSPTCAPGGTSPPARRSGSST